MKPEPAEDTERLTARAARIVLAVAYLCFAGLYAWQASKRLSPTIFSDEIEFTHISRAIAATGVPSQRGDPSGFETLYTYVVAPAWWLDDTQQAWEMAKLIGVLVMTAAIFPAYALARFVVSRPWALAAAIASVAAPPLSYAPYLLDEPLAYPTATTVLWAITAATARPTRRRLALAAVLTVLAPLVRGELAALVAVFAASVFTLLWRTDRFRRWRTTWTAGDWLGVALLAVGLAVVASAAAGHRSEPWYQATAFLKQRMFEHGLSALAAMYIGIGVLPILGTVAAFLSGRVRATANGRAFVTVGVAAFGGFVGYAAVKGAYLSITFADLVVERNVIYLVPVAFAATAAVLARPIATIPALAAGLVLALYVVMNAELKLEYGYFEAPGLALATLTNRELSWDAIDIKHALITAVIVSVALLAARSLIRSRALGIGVAVVAACAVASWAIATEVNAARGLNDFSATLYGSTPRPVDWVDEATGGEPALYLGQQIKDHNPIWLLEFWNRSVERIWSLDGSADPPSLSPDLGAPDGTISPSPEVEWVVTGNGVAVQGERVGEPHGNNTLVHVTPPVRLRFAQIGVYDDGWTGRHATYSQYAPDDGVSRGFARIALSRQGACGANVPTAEVVVKVGRVVVRDKQPGMGRLFDVVRRKLKPCALEVVVVRATVPYHVDVTVSPTFVPAEIDASSGDARELGAQVHFDFLPLR